MTNYGAIPTSSAPEAASSSSPLDVISRAKERGYTALAARRPWREMADPRAFGIPHSLGDAHLRIRANASYFAMNYAVVVLLVVFLSLLWHPISLIVFIAMMAVWLVLYFLRDVPLVLFNRVIGDRLVLIVLSVVTIVVLLLAGATLNIVVSVLVGLAVVLVHATFRKTDNHEIGEEGASSGGGGGWYSVAGEPAGV